MDFTQSGKKRYRILLVEDNPADVRLTKEAIKEGDAEVILDVVTNGEEALDFLFQREEHISAQRPDLILLDLNLPKRTGFDVLQEIKTHESLKKIPVIVLTTSDAEHDVTRAYAAHANCYILKPVDFDDFAKVIRLIETFWLGIVKLPNN